MSNSTGPDTNRPDPQPASPLGANGDKGEQPAAMPDGTPVADPAVLAAALDGGAQSPETKEKNKIFETVRLKARASLLEHEVERLKAEAEQLKAAPAEFQDRNLRLMAEMENLRRRTERERADMAKFAITRFARDVLTVADNFQRAIDAVPKEALAVEGPLMSFHEGVALTERELVNVLERHGVKRVDPVGMRFDPNHHQAMMEVENLEVPAGTVVQAFQPAYLIEDRILRPAMVVVSRGGPKVAKPAANEGEAPPDDVAGGPDGTSPGPR